MCLTKTGVGDSLSLTKKLEGRKVQFSPFLLSRNIRKSHLKDRGFLSKRSNPLHSNFISLYSITSISYSDVSLPEDER